MGIITMCLEVFFIPPKHKSEIIINDNGNVKNNLYMTKKWDKKISTDMFSVALSLSRSH